MHNIAAQYNSEIGARASLSCASPTDDCDDDLITNYVEDIDGDGDWTNDDSDGDGVADYLDRDYDGDGWPTWLECPEGRTANVDNCPGFGPAKDYLSNRLFNCDLPLLQLTYDSPHRISFHAYIHHNDTLVELGEYEDNNTAASGRSMVDGRIYWMNGRDLAIYSWAPNNTSMAHPPEYGSGYTRGVFTPNGSYLVQRDTNLFVFNQTFNRTKVATLNYTGGGGDIVALPTGDYLLVASSGSLYTIDENFSNLMEIGNMSKLENYSRGAKGAALLPNGSLIYSHGKNIMLLEGDWIDGFNESGEGFNGGNVSLKLLHGDSEVETGGDMAVCLIPVYDRDGDGLPDYHEEYIFGTNSNSTDSDNDELGDYLEVMNLETEPMDPDSDSDGLLDGVEYYTYSTDPTNIDTDNDGCSDWYEIEVEGTNPLVNDSDGDGILDCKPLAETQGIPGNLLDWLWPSLCIILTLLVLITLLALRDKDEDFHKEEKKEAVLESD